jgi:DNA recombination protein RmuC
LLGTVKAEFGKFAGVLEKTRDQLDTVRNSIDKAGVRTRAIERQLKGVETLPGTEVPLLGATSNDDESE